MARLFFGCLLLLVPTVAILLPNHNIKNSNSASTSSVSVSDAATQISGESNGKQDRENGERRSQPMTLPVVQTFNAGFGGDAAAVGQIAVQPKIMSAAVPDAVIGPSLDQIPIYNNGNGNDNLPKIQDILSGKVNGFNVPGNDKAVKLPSYDLTQISTASHSIVNPFIPPVAIKKNKTGESQPSRRAEVHILPFEKPKQQHSLPVVAPQKETKKKQGRALFNTNLLAGSPVMKLLSNLSSDCQQSFSALATSVNSLTISDFKQKFYNWSVVCDKEDLVEELENRTESAREAVRANMTALIQSLPLYLMPLQALEKNESMTVAEKLQAVRDYMASVPDPNVVKTISFLNELFVGKMIPQFLPALGKRQAKKSQRLKSLTRKTNQNKRVKRSTDSSSEEMLSFELGEPHHL